MVAIKKRKSLKISNPNIFLINDKTGQKREFVTQEDANDFLDSHKCENPGDWHSEFDKHFEKRRLKEIEEIGNLNDIEIEVLKLISLENPIKTISKILEKDKESIDTIVIKLSKLLLISSCNKYGWKINESGKNLLKKKELEW